MKTFLFTLLYLFTFNAFAQSLNFPGKSIEMLEGKELKVLPQKENQQQYGYKDFYTDEALKKIYKSKNYSTKYEALAGKVFKVVSYKPSKGDYIITLHNDETGTLYYKYNENISSLFKFEVIGGLQFPKDFFCTYNQIDKVFNYDLVKYEYTRYSPTTEGITLYLKDLIYTLKVIIKASSDHRESDMKGLKLLLKNGKEVSFPDAKIAVESSSNDYKYSTTVVVSKEQFGLLKESPMIKKVLGNKEEDIIDGALIMEFFRCLSLP